MDMDMSGSSMAASASATAMPTAMGMVFHSSVTGDALFGPKWVPMSTAGYVGTLFFLAALGLIFRGLVSGKFALESYWRRKFAGLEVVVTDKVGDQTVIRDGTTKGRLHWRTSVDIPRAFYQLVLAGISYLLMIAVMTMNVGYFMAVLAGIFFGELLFGRFSGDKNVIL